MPRTLRFGVMTLQHIPWSVLAERWDVLDRSIFDSAWVGDQLTTRMWPDAPMLEGWTLLAALAARTRRIRIGPMVTTISYRNPALLAKQAVTLDHIASGRLELGIGAGGNPADHTMTGVPLWDSKERVARYREFVDVVDALLRQETTTYAGNYYQAQVARMAPAPVQQPRPPLTLAALGPTTIKIAAQYADAWSSYVRPPIGVAEALALTRDRVAMLEDACAAVGRDPTTIVRSLLCWPMMPDMPFVSLDAFRDFVGRYAAIGIDEFIFYWMREDLSMLGGDLSLVERTLDRSTLDWLAAEAIPAVRSDQEVGRRQTGSARDGTQPDVNIGLVRRYIEEANNGGNTALVDELIASDYVWHGGPTRREELKRFLA